MAGFCIQCSKSVFHKIREIDRLGEKGVTSQEGLRSMELVSVS
jgi:hypothetical protein